MDFPKVDSPKADILSTIVRGVLYAAVVYHSRPEKRVVLIVRLFSLYQRLVTVSRYTGRSTYECFQMNTVVRGQHRRIHMKNLVIHKLGSLEFTTHNDLYQQY